MPSQHSTLPPDKRMVKGRASLMFDYPWFGSLALRLHVEATDTKGMYQGQAVPTMATNGQVLAYNPAFVDTLTDQEISGVIAHEVLHCALLHPFRRGGRDHKKWNVACDYAINQICADSGIKLPSCAIQPNPQWTGWSADKIYSAMPEPTEQQKQQAEMGEVGDSPQDGEGDDKGDSPDGPKGKEKGTGEGKGQSEGMSETDWQIAAKQAEMVAQKAGKMPGGLARGLAGTRESKADWRALLQRFITSTVPHDYSWSRPNRRFIYQGLYLPGIVKENMGEFVVAIDTSGSVTPGMLEQFAGEIQEIMSSCRPEKVTVVYCDSQVNGSVEFSPDEQVELKMMGGGGTAFSPVFDWVKEKGIEPKALIYLTDLDSYDRPVQPEYPVLWVTPEWVSQNPAWGEVIRITVVT